METTQRPTTQSLRHHRILAATGLCLVLWLGVIVVCRYSGVGRPLGEHGVAIALAVGLAIDAAISLRGGHGPRTAQK